MTPFILIGALMVSLALALVAWPLFRERPPRDRGTFVLLGVLALALPLATTLLYRSVSTWNWDPAARETGAPHSIEEMVAKLEDKLRRQPGDVDGWLMLGRSQLALNNPPRAVVAFAEAYKVAGGRSIEAVVGYGEALTIADEGSVKGRAGELFEEALKLDPANPKALWYGGLSAAVTGKLDTARERWLMLLKQDLPADIRALLVERLGDVDKALGRKDDPELAALAGPSAAAATPAVAGPPPAAMATAPTAGAAAGPGTVSVNVNVKVAPALAGQVPAGAPLFVLARDPTQPGPPFAVKRYMGAALPMAVTLTEQDAMIPVRTIKTAHQLMIVARYSVSGAPTAASGDLYGEVAYDLARGGAVDLVIDRRVP
jgi:cytochrome c-type biogenesis protein CcmH